jgi:hypothetical protein
VEKQKDIWIELNALGLAPGVAFFLQGVKVTKTQGFMSFFGILKKVAII